VAQFEIHRNTGARSAASRPFLLDIQSNRFARQRFRIVAVLARRSALPPLDRIYAGPTPIFSVAGQDVFLNPFEITPVPVDRLGPAVGRLDDEEDQRRVQKATDDVLAHA